MPRERTYPVRFTLDQVFHAKAVFQLKAEEMRRYLADPGRELSAETRADIEVRIQEYAALAARFASADIRSPVEKRLDSWARRINADPSALRKRRRRRRSRPAAG